MQLNGITDAVAAQQGEGVQYKGVKAHFRMDNSGIVRLDGAEVVVEKAPEKTESAFSGENESHFSSLSLVD